MGIPGEYDSPRLMEAYATVAAAAEKVSVNGRLLSIGIGGIKWVWSSQIDPGCGSCQTVLDQISLKP